MIKRILCYILLVILVFSFCACAEQQSFDQPVAFYYPELPQENGAIENVVGSEIREGSSFSGDLSALLGVYLQGPRDEQLSAAFFQQITLIDATVLDNQISLVFSENFSQLSGIDRSIACVCISMTCMDFTSADTVEIFVENTLFDGNESIVISRDAIFIQDSTAGSQP